MASPQLEKGYTKLSDELLEAVYRCPIASVPAFRLLLWVVRNTYGWNRHFTESSTLSKMAEEMDMPKSSVHLALQVLIEAKILTRDEMGRLRIQKNYELWDVESTNRGRKKSSNSLDAESSNSPDGKEEIVQSDGRNRPIPRTESSNSLTAYKEKDSKDSKDKQIAQAAAPKELTPVQKVIRGFKEAKGVGADNADWDRKFFTRHIRAATELLTAFDGDPDRAIVYILVKGEEWKHLSDWGLEAVLKAAGREYLRIGGLENGPENKMGADRLDGPRRGGGFTSSGDLARDALRAIESSAVSSEKDGHLASDGSDLQDDQP